MTPRRAAPRARLLERAVQRGRSEMSLLSFTLAAFALSIAAGVLGSMLGLGGGIIVVPALTLLLGVDVRHAIGASVVSVIATSSGAAAAYVRERLTNLRIAIFLEVATTSGALSGAVLAGLVPTRILEVIFGAVLAVSAVMMMKKIRAGAAAAPLPAGGLASRLHLEGEYWDVALERTVPYRAARAASALGLMYGAGVIGGLLGIGAGVMKVLALDLAMGLPIKVSTATSNFMIGVTAAASAGVYFARGEIQPEIAAPVATGVLAGAFIGSKLLGKANGTAIRAAFVLVLLWIAGQMLFEGIARR